MRKKNILKYAASFGDTRKMLEWAKSKGVSIERNPTIVAKKYLEHVGGGTKFNISKKLLKGYTNSNKKAGPFFLRDTKSVFIPRSKDFNYKDLGIPPTDVLAHELGHAKDLKSGFVGWLKNKYSGKLVGPIPRERRANSEAIKNFISPEGKKSFAKNISEGGGFKSYTEATANALRGNSYKDVKGLKYKDWVQRKENLLSGKLKGFLTEPFKKNLNPLQKGQDLIQSSIQQAKVATDIDTAKSVSSDLMKQLRPHAYKMDIAGSISRNHENVKDIDLVVWPKNTFKEKVQQIGLSGGDKVIKSEYKGMPINIWLTDKQSYEPTRMHFSLGKHIIRLKGDAKARGMKLTRHGLFIDDRHITGKEKIIKQILATPEGERFVKEKQYPRETTNYLRFRQADPGNFTEFKTKHIGGDALVLGKKSDGTWGIQSIMVKK